MSPVPTRSGLRGRPLNKAPRQVQALRLRQAPRQKAVRLLQAQRRNRVTLPRRVRPPHMGTMQHMGTRLRQQEPQPPRQVLPHRARPRRMETRRRMDWLLPRLHLPRGP
ncbi:MAG TPA: hypothetical protein VL418_10120 [Devosiaceae bacterium]|nr:hypothetical protein [Devosiaceae bacterium]